MCPSSSGLLLWRHISQFEGGNGELVDKTFPVLLATGADDLPLIAGREQPRVPRRDRVHRRRVRGAGSRLAAVRKAPLTGGR